MDKEGLKELGLCEDAISFIENKYNIFLATRANLCDQELDIAATKYALGELKNRLQFQSPRHITYQDAIKVIKEELKKDQSGGSIYYGWQSNLAMLIMDNSDLNAEECNIIAIKFLNRLMEG